jgi:predicted dithiol-disulfide oxidoreductase (DUF899 family)
MSTESPASSFPQESAEYRKARKELLTREIELRRNIEKVAAARRKLPLGGEVPEDYTFEQGPLDLSLAGPIRKVHLSELFDAGKESLLIYSYMYGPAMATPCTSCTSILDGLNGTAPHVRDRVNFVVVAKSPIARIRAVAGERGWHNLRLLSSAGNSYNLDYRGENKEGGQLPSLNVFARRDGKIHHFYHTELLNAPREAGQDGRHVDLIWPLWNLFDYTPEGRGEKWYPKLSYR